MKYKYILLFLLLSILVMIHAILMPVSFQPKQSITVEIASGTSVHQLIQQLKSQQLLHNYFPYVWFFRSWPFKSGEYRFTQQTTPYRILQMIKQGKVLTYNITFAEGTNMFEMADILNQYGLISKKEFLKSCQDKTLIQSLLQKDIESLEGYLYPNTYQITKDMKASTLVKTMVKEFLKIYQQIPSSIHTPLTRHQIVILASLVEKETGAAHERSQIASVFHNRLKIGMKFQSDPTILYGMLRNTGMMPNNIRKKDILAKTPYNTYTINGFPKGPITNPGRKAIYAVLNPKNTSYYYFVSKNDGTHVFSTNFKDHQKAVNIYQKKISSSKKHSKQQTKRVKKLYK